MQEKLWKADVKKPLSDTGAYSLCISERTEGSCAGKAGRTYGTFQNEVQTDGKLYPFPVKTDDIRRVGNGIE